MVPVQQQHPAELTLAKLVKHKSPHSGRDCTDCCVLDVERGAKHVVGGFFFQQWQPVNR
jgi:hypothetical protein